MYILKPLNNHKLFTTKMIIKIAIKYAVILIKELVFIYFPSSINLRSLACSTAERINATNIPKNNCIRLYCLITPHMIIAKRIMINRIKLNFDFSLNSLLKIIHKYYTTKSRIKKSERKNSLFLLLHSRLLRLLHSTLSLVKSWLLHSTLHLVKCRLWLNNRFLWCKTFVSCHHNV